MTSPRTSPVAVSFTTVPGGTGSSMSSVEAPVLFFPMPCCARSAFHTVR